MIDRQRLFEFFAQEHGLILIESQMNDVIHEVNLRQDNWVSVEDRFPTKKPPEKGNSICIDVIIGYSNGVVTTGDFGWSHMNNDDWVPTFMPRYIVSGDVTCWMPLPDPPKKG